MAGTLKEMYSFFLELLISSLLAVVAGDMVDKMVVVAEVVRVPYE
jgi:hypothetical protein